MRFLVPSLVVALAFSFRAGAVETTVKDSEGLTAWLETPTAQPEPGKTYWLVVSIHGVGADGSQANGWVRNWVQRFGDVIVLAPTFGGPKRKDDSKEAKAAAWAGSYQMSAPAHAEKLDALIATIAKTWPLHPKILLNGFSAGAQFAHRYAMKHPENVAAVAAHSGGSWAKVGGADSINPDAQSVPFAVSCGEEDRGSGGPDKVGRLDGAKSFAANLKKLGFSVDLQTWPGVGHEFSPGANAQGLALLEKIRATAPAGAAP